MEEEEEECKCPAGLPGWLATFADLMSLLLAFFVLLFSFSSVDDKKFKNVGGSLKDAFGVQTLREVFMMIQGTSLIAVDFSAGDPETNPINIIPPDDVSIDKMFRQKIMQGDKKDAEIGGAGENAGDFEFDLEEVFTKQQVVDMMLKALGKLEKIVQGQSQAEFDRLKKGLEGQAERGELSISMQGNKISIRIPESALFRSGQFELRPDFARTLKDVADLIRDSEGKIVIEGHTDNIPTSGGRFRSNWELSASRAVSVVEYMIRFEGLPPERLEAKGVADTMPIADNSTPEGRRENRRVEILLEYTDMGSLPDYLRNVEEDEGGEILMDVDELKDAAENSDFVDIESRRQINEERRDDLTRFLPDQVGQSRNRPRRSRRRFGSEPSYDLIFDGGNITSF